MTDLFAFWLRAVDSAHALLDFMSAGGVVMWALAVLCVVFWTLVFERFWYMRKIFPRWVQERREAWQQVLADDNGNWQRAVRLAWLAQARQQLAAPLRLGKTLVALYPLLGLLGTVLGMIVTFQAITQSGGGDSRLMADGISQALVTTVLGLVVAIPLLFLHSLLASRSKGLIQILEQQSAGLIALHLSGAPRRD